MTESAKNDVWNSGESYEAFMGRWSRKVSVRFLDWLNPDEDIEWLEVGCGSGALSSNIINRCNPRNLISIDPSQGFIDTAEQSVTDERAIFQTGDAQSLPFEDNSRDIITSALVLNFIPDIPKALSEMKRVVRPGGSIAFYVWDYPNGGLEFVREFWKAAISLDPTASQFAENKRFSFCTPEGLTELTTQSGLISIECSAIEVPTIFKNFDDYWHPFTLGIGPAPGYCVNLEDDARQILREKLSDDLPRQADGSIALRAKAWAVKAICA